MSLKWISFPFIVLMKLYFEGTHKLNGREIGERNPPTWISSAFLVRVT